jgi:hypothetical protein
MNSRVASQRRLQSQANPRRNRICNRTTATVGPGMPCSPSKGSCGFRPGTGLPAVFIPKRSEGSLRAFRTLRYPLLTDPLRQRPMNCEEPNFSCDDRCNAPIIRRKGSALLLLVANPNQTFLLALHVITGRTACRRRESASYGSPKFRSKPLFYIHRYRTPCKQSTRTNLPQLHRHSLPIALPALRKPFAHRRSQSRGIDR